MPIVKIPQSQKPTFKVSVNGEEYEYPSGQEVEVPESVASVIQNIEDNQPKADSPPVNNGVCGRIVPHYFEKNGEYTAPDGVAGYNPVHVAVPPPRLVGGFFSENGEYDPPEGAEGFDHVTVAVTQGIGNGIVYGDDVAVITVYGSEWEMYTMGKEIRNVTFAENVTDIPPNAFEASLLEDFSVIPSHIATIGECAFANTGIRTLRIESDFITIGERAFEDSSVEKIYVLGKVYGEDGQTANISFSAFSGCYPSDIYFSQSEEEVNSAIDPQMGAGGATLHYNYTE